MRFGTEIAKWVVGIAFGAGTAYGILTAGTTGTRTDIDALKRTSEKMETRIEATTAHTARHDVELGIMRRDIQYLVDGMDQLLGRPTRRRNGGIGH
jgi:hypothetical protein